MAPILREAEVEILIARGLRAAHLRETAERVGTRAVVVVSHLHVEFRIDRVQNVDIQDVAATAAWRLAEDNSAPDSAPVLPILGVGMKLSKPLRRAIDGTNLLCRAACAVCVGYRWERSDCAR